jgi:hypothetical protein
MGSVQRQGVEADVGIEQIMERLRAAGQLDKMFPLAEPR